MQPMTSNEWWSLFKFGAAVLILVFLLSAVAYGLGWIGSAADVTKQEFGPQAALEKYEWFIDQANAIRKADTDVKLFEQRRSDVEKQYANTYGEDRSKWAPSTRALYSRAAETTRDDLVAVVSNRNNLVKEYNAQSEKFNWAPFQTRPDVPPRSFFEYVMR